MANITIRNIPDDVFERIRVLAALERRSINNELLVLIEEGTGAAVRNRLRDRKPVSREAQLHLWQDLCGRWEDDRSTERIVEDIREARTLGRELPLDPA